MLHRLTPSWLSHLAHGSPQWSLQFACNPVKSWLLLQPCSGVATYATAAHTNNVAISPPYFKVLHFSDLPKLLSHQPITEYCITGYCSSRFTPVAGLQAVYHGFGVTVTSKQLLSQKGKAVKDALIRVLAESSFKVRRQ